MVYASLKDPKINGHPCGFDIPVATETMLNSVCIMPRYATVAVTNGMRLHERHNQDCCEKCGAVLANDGFPLTAMLLISNSSTRDAR